MQNTKQIKIGAMLSYFAIILNVGAGLLYTPWMVKMIGQSQYGLYTLANSLISLFLVDFGLSSATARYVSKYRAENNIQKVNNFLGIIYKLHLIIDGLIFLTLIIVYFFIDVIYKNLTPLEIAQFKVVYIIAGLFSVINFPFVTLNGILTAYEEFIHLKLSEVLYRLMLVAIMIAVLLNGGGLYSLVIVNAVVGLVVIAYKLIVIKRKLPINVNLYYRDVGLTKDLFGFSAWSTVSTLAQRLVFSITPTVLGIVANSAAIAVFGIVSTIEGYVFVFTTAINGMFMPTITRAFHKSDAAKELNPLFIGVGKFQYAINGLIVAVFFAVGMQFIELWMGHDYSTAYYGILLTIVPGLFYNSLQIANTSLIVTNKVKYQAFVNMFMGVINIVLAFILSKRFGVLGACISIFIAFTVRNIILNIICYKVLKLDIFRFIRDCYIRMSIPICISVLIGFLMNRIICPQGWTDLIIRGLVILIIFILSLFICGLNSTDRKYILQHLRHKG